MDELRELKKIPKPIYANFIIENAEGVMTQSGAYYHFGDVISLLKKWDCKKEKEFQNYIDSCENPTK